MNQLKVYEMRLKIYLLQDISQEQQRKQEGVQKYRRDLRKDLQRREAEN